MAANEDNYTLDQVFNGDKASKLVDALRTTFASGKTRSYEWRVSQLKSLLKLSTDHEQEIVDALRSDLSKPELETVVYEVLESVSLICGISPFFMSFRCLYICY